MIELSETEWETIFAFLLETSAADPTLSDDGLAGCLEHQSDFEFDEARELVRHWRESNA
jgi:hypothetical protein